MSYILGVRRFGVAAIFADSFLGRGPLTDRRHDFTSHKNGVLFPGCIYGISGAWDAACKFIARVQGHATGSTLGERWRSLERTVRIYDFPSVASEFQILFSSRHRIQPKFYVLNSSDRKLIRLHGDAYSLGQGREILGEPAFAFFDTMLLPEHLAALQGRSQNFTLTEYPYMLAFLLHQFSHGPRSYDLLQKDVGGFFHFVRQDSESEQRQKPSLYVFAGKFTGTERLVVVRHRIAFRTHPEYGDLLIFGEKNLGTKAEFGILAPNMTSVPKVTQPEINAIIGAANAEPPYHFLAAGPWDGERGSFGLFVDVFDGGYDADMTDFLSVRVAGFLTAHIDDRLEEYAGINAQFQAGANTQVPPGWEIFDSDRRKWEPDSKRTL